LDFANVTDSDATTIGAGLALSHGVSDVIAMIEPELTALNRTVNASGAMLQTIMQLGERLNAFNANVTPIAAPSRVQHLPEAHMEHSRSYVPEQTRTPAAYRPNLHDVRGSPVRLERATPPGPQKTPRPDGSSPPLRPLSRQDAAMAPHTVSPSPQAAAAHAPRAVIAPATSSPVEPPSSSVNSVVAPWIAPGAPDVVRSPTSEVGIAPAAVVPVTTTAGIGAPPDIRVEQIVIGAMAPSRATSHIPASQATTDMPASQVTTDVPASQATADMPAPQITTPLEGGRLATAMPYTTADATVQEDGTLSASTLSEPPRTESEPRQGILVLDIDQLGRWVLDHLERHASRPGAMTTGIDPRMNATYPGASTGA
jgi:hypothetical protein